MTRSFPAHAILSQFWEALTSLAFSSFYVKIEHPPVTLIKSATGNDLALHTCRENFHGVLMTSYRLSKATQKLMQARA